MSLTPKIKRHYGIFNNNYGSHYKNVVQFNVTY